jgi:hypothetical protein
MEKAGGGAIEGGSKKRKVTIQLLPLIIIIINIFNISHFQNYHLNILLFTAL